MKTQCSKIASFEVLRVSAALATIGEALWTTEQATRRKKTKGRAVEVERAVDGLENDASVFRMAADLHIPLDEIQSTASDEIDDMRENWEAQSFAAQGIHGVTA